MFTTSKRLRNLEEKLVTVEDYALELRGVVSKEVSSLKQEIQKLNDLLFDRVVKMAEKPVKTKRRKSINGQWAKSLGGRRAIAKKCVELLIENGAPMTREELVNKSMETYATGRTLERMRNLLAYYTKQHPKEFPIEYLGDGRYRIRKENRKVNLVRGIEDSVRSRIL